MKNILLLVSASILLMGCSHGAKKPSGSAFPINTSYQTGR